MSGAQDPRRAARVRTRCAARRTGRAGRRRAAWPRAATPSRAAGASSAPCRACQLFPDPATAGAARAERGGLFRRRGRVGRMIPGGASGAARPACFEQRQSGCPRARAPRPRPLPRLASGRSTGPAAHRASVGVAPAAASPDRARCRPTPRPHAGCLRSPRTKVPEWLNKSARYAVVWDILEQATKTTWTTTPTSATQTTTSTPERINPPFF